MAVAFGFCKNEVTQVKKFLHRDRSPSTSSHSLDSSTLGNFHRLKLVIREQPANSKRLERMGRLSRGMEEGGGEIRGTRVTRQVLLEITELLAHITHAETCLLGHGYSGLPATSTKALDGARQWA